MAIEIEFTRSLREKLLFHTNNVEEAKKLFKQHFGDLEKPEILKITCMECHRCGCTSSLSGSHFICERCNSR